MFNNFFKSYRLWAKWRNTVEMAIRRMRIPCWMRKNTNTHLEYVICIAPLQQWLHKGASLLRYTYIACPILYLNKAAEKFKKN